MFVKIFPKVTQYLLHCTQPSFVSNPDKKENKYKFYSTFLPSAATN